MKTVLTMMIAATLGLSSMAFAAETTTTAPAAATAAAPVKHAQKAPTAKRYHKMEKKAVKAPEQKAQSAKKKAKKAPHSVAAPAKAVHTAV